MQSKGLKEQLSEFQIRKFENSKTYDFIITTYKFSYLSLFLYLVFLLNEKKKKKTFFRFYIKGLCLMPRLLKKTEQNLPL